MGLVAGQAAKLATCTNLSAGTDTLPPAARRYVKFDTYHPAVDRGLPVTRVISRTLLQQILAEAAMELAGENVIQNGVHVVGYKDVCPRS